MDHHFKILKFFEDPIFLICYVLWRAATKYYWKRKVEYFYSFARMKASCITCEADGYFQVDRKNKEAVDLYTTSQMGLDVYDMDASRDVYDVKGIDLEPGDNIEVECSEKKWEEWTVDEWTTEEEWTDDETDEKTGLSKNPEESTCEETKEKTGDDKDRTGAETEQKTIDEAEERTDDEKEQTTGDEAGTERTDDEKEQTTGDEAGTERTNDEKEQKTGDEAGTERTSDEAGTERTSDGKEKESTAEKDMEDKEAYYLISILDHKVWPLCHVTTVHQGLDELIMDLDELNEDSSNDDMADWVLVNE